MTDALADALRAVVRAVVREELAGLARSEPAVRLLSVEDAARCAGVGRSMMYELLARGRVRSVKLGRRRLVPSDALDELAERGEP
jgi:excisionase family DNA binding protein